MVKNNYKTTYGQEYKIHVLTNLLRDVLEDVDGGPPELPSLFSSSLIKQIELALEMVDEDGYDFGDDDDDEGENEL